MKRLALLIVLMTVAVTGARYALTAPPILHTAVNAQPVIKIAEPKSPEVSEVIASTNAYRSSKGLTNLTENAQLDQSACLKAQDMVTKNYWAHVSPDGIEPWHWFEQVRYAYKAAGENLAYGFNSGDDVVNAWIHSPSHEANLVGNYTEVGICAKHEIFQGSMTNLTVVHYGLPQ